MFETKSIALANAIPYAKQHFFQSEKYAQRFYADGFLVIEDVFSKTEMMTLNEVLLYQLEKTELGGISWPLHYLEAAKNTAFKKLACDERLLPLLQPLLGSDIQLQHSKFAVKFPGKTKGTVHWHQDFAFFPHTNDSLLALAISLTDITPENGAMIMLRGSHHAGLLNHFDADGSFAEQCVDESILDERDRYVFACPKIGGVSIHHCLTAHCSNDNSTNTSRNMVVFEYRAADAYQLADGIWDDTGLQICGKSSNTVRLGGRFLKKNPRSEIALSLPSSSRYGAAFPFGHAYNQHGKMAKESVSINRQIKQ